MKKTIPPFKLNEEIYKELNKEATERDIPMAALYREVLTNYVKKGGKK